MSQLASELAWKLDIFPNSKLVLLAMAFNCDAYKNCALSVSDFVVHTGLERRAVIRAIEDLEKNNFIRVFRESGLRNLYALKVGHV